MNLAKIPLWQEGNFTKLLQLNKNLPSAILLCGDAEIQLLATNFIATKLCENITQELDNYCGYCTSCLLLQEQSHLDLFVLDNSILADTGAKNITVDMVRKAIDFAYLTPHMSKYRIIFIPNMELLNKNSANALLKLMEEPPYYVLFVMVTNNLGQILPTIKSRCHKMTFPSNRLLDTHSIINYDGKYTEFWLKFYKYSSKIEIEIVDEELEIIMQMLIHPSIDNIFNCSEYFNGKKIDFGFTLDFLYKWLSELEIFFHTGKLDIFSDYIDKINDLLLKLNHQKLFIMQDELMFLIRHKTHPLNYKLQVENILFQYQNLFS